MAKAQTTEEHNRQVTERIRAKVAAGRDYTTCAMSDGVYIALQYGRGKPSSSFIAAPEFVGPAQVLR